MTLREMLESMDPAHQIKIGAESGSSFFYCGTAGEFLAEMETFDEAIKAETKNAAERAKREFIRYATEGFVCKVQIPRKMSKEEKEMEFSEWTRSRVDAAVQSIRKEYISWLATTGTKESAAIDAERLSREGRSLGSREVLDSFIADPIVEPIPTMVISIYGWEYGRYWMMEEYPKKENKNEEENENG